MKYAVLTVGPQGSGKSTFCEKVIAANPHVQLVSRDKILIEMFGTFRFDGYSGQYKEGWEELWKRVKTALRKDDALVIVDAWNDDALSRVKITHTLRRFGADLLAAWLFSVPQEVHTEWLFARWKQENPSPEKSSAFREMSDKARRDSFRRHHQFFEESPVTDTEDFDFIRIINPQNPVPSDLFADIPVGK